MSNTIGYDLEGFANSSVEKIITTTSTDASISIYLPYDSDLNDDSTNAHSGTASGSAAITTSVKKYGAGSLSLNGTSQYVSYANDADFQFGSGDFTIEAWVYQTAAAGSDSADRHSIVNRMASTSNRSFAVDIRDLDSKQKLVFGFSADGSNSHEYRYDCDVTINTWHHIAIVREGSTVHGFLNGVKANFDFVSSTVLTEIGTETIYVGTSDLAVGHRGLSSQYFQGYIDDLRIIKGTALYTTDFIAPTSAVGLTAEVTATGVDQKFLSSVWNPDDVSEKMADGTWIRNDATSGANPAGVVVQGAGLEVAGHRWYVAPAGPSTFIVNMVAGGGASAGGNGTGGGGGGGAFAAVDMLNSPGAYPGAGTYTIVVGAEGRANQPTPYLSPVSSPNGSAGGGGYSAITSAWPGPELSGWDNYTIPGSVTIYAIVGAGGGGGFSRFSPVPGGGAGGGGHPDGLDAPNPSSGTGSPHNGPFGKGGTQSAGGQGAPDRPLGPGIQYRGGVDHSGSTSWNHGGAALSTPTGGSGGAGGGGWYGGGSGDYAGEGGPDGETPNRNGTGGGGGSSYKAPTITWFHNDAGSGSNATGGATGNPGSPTPIGHNSIASTAGVGVSGVGPATARPGYRGAVQIVLGSDPSEIHDYTTPGIYTVDLTTL